MINENWLNKLTVAEVIGRLKFDLEYNKWSEK